MSRPRSVLRSLLIALTVSVITLVPAGRPATAATGIVIARTQVAPGGALVVSGTGFGDGESVTLSAPFPLYDGNTLIVTSTVRTTAQGNFSGARLLVPANARVTTVAVTARGATTGRIATAPVSIVYHPRVSLSPSTVVPGGGVTVTGSGFVVASRVSITVTLARTVAGYETITRTVITNGQGVFVARLQLPADIRSGRYTVTAFDTLGHFSAAASLTVASRPVIALHPAAVPPGTNTEVAGSGYGAGVVVTVSATFPLSTGGRHTVTGRVTTGANGTFSLPFSVPSQAAARTVTVTASSQQVAARADLTVERRVLPMHIAVSPSTVIPGAATTVEGTSFPAGDHVAISATVRLTSSSTLVLRADAVADGAGRFSVSLPVPAAVAGGAYTVIARSVRTGGSTTATVIVARLAPSLAVSPTTAAPGTKVSVQGSGFPAGTSVAVSFGGGSVATSPTTASGQFSVQITVPAEAASGTYRIAATDAVGHNATADLLVERAISTHDYIAGVFTGRGYLEYLAFLNPTPTLARVTITYEPTSGTTLTKTISVSPESRATEDVNADLGAGVSAGVVVAADVPIAAARVVFHGTDGAVDPGASSPATHWYFANGNTSHGYREFVAIENPNPIPARVVVRFLPAHHRSFTIVRTVAATSRTTVSVSKYVHKDAVAVIVAASDPVVASRTLFAGPAITSKTGVPTARQSWYFTAGPTGRHIRNWLAVLNPFNNWSYVSLHIYGPGGRQLRAVAGWMRAQSRVGYLINSLVHRSDVAVVLTGSHPVVAEQMTYNGRASVALTDSFGAPTPSTVWEFPEAATGPGQTDTLTLFNPTMAPESVVVRVFTTAGQVAQRTYIVSARSDHRVAIGSIVPDGQLGLMAISSGAFIAQNRDSFDSGHGAMTSTGISP